MTSVARGWGGKAIRVGTRSTQTSLLAQHMLLPWTASTANCVPYLPGHPSSGPSEEGGREQSETFKFSFSIGKKLLSLLSCRETKGKCPKSGDAPAEGTKPNACKIKCGVFVLFYFCLQQPR